MITNGHVCVSQHHITWTIWNSPTAWMIVLRKPKCGDRRHWNLLWKEIRSLTSDLCSFGFLFISTQDSVSNCHCVYARRYLFSSYPCIYFVLPLMYSYFYSWYFFLVEYVTTVVMMLFVVYLVHIIAWLIVSVCEPCICLVIYVPLSSRVCFVIMNIFGYVFIKYNV